MRCCIVCLCSLRPYHFNEYLQEGVGATGVGSFARPPLLSISTRPFPFARPEPLDKPVSGFTDCVPRSTPCSKHVPRIPPHLDID